MISVVIPSKNRHEQAIEAVVSSLAIPLVGEIIIVDDSSRPPLIESFPKDISSSKKVKFINNTKQQGAQGARVTGALHSKNDIVLFLDSDDILIKKGVETLYSQISEDTELAMVYGNVVFGERKSNFLQVSGISFRQILKNMSLCPFSGIMVRRNFVPWENLDLNLPAWQDDDFCLTVSFEHKIKFVDTTAAIMKVSNDSISKSYHRQFIGLALLLAKWQKHLSSEFGLMRLILWRFRLLSILFLTISQDIATAKNNYIFIEKIFIYLFSKTFFLTGKAIRLLLSPFFDRIYA